jgi:hypothetical protein
MNWTSHLQYLAECYSQNQSFDKIDNIWATMEMFLRSAVTLNVWVEAIYTFAKDDRAVIMRAMSRSWEGYT